jgi:hypothetical protein
MRFTKQKKLREAYHNHTRKTITKFLLFPVTINHETRWFEEAKIEMRVERKYNAFIKDTYRWVYSEFID